MSAQEVADPPLTDVAPFDLLGSAIAAVLAAVLTVPALRLWQADLAVPFAYSGDANSHGMLVKAVLDHGWYERNPNLAAPFGQVFNDFPMPDNLHLVVAKVLGLVLDSYGAVLNVYFLAGFALAAFFGTLVLRSLGVSRATAIVTGVLYAFAPYHFMRGEAQLFLASYYAVPLAVLLAMGALGHVELFPRRPHVNGPAAYVSTRAAATIGMCILVGSSSAYYGAFGVILIGTVLVGYGLVRRDGRSIVVGVVVAAAISLTVLANVAPDLLWSRSHGRNTEAVVRAPGDTETYSLKLTQLLLPSPHHRIDVLAKTSQRYLAEFPLPSEPHPLGATAAIGVVTALAAAFAFLFRAGEGGAAGADRTMLHLACLVLASLLAAMTGGLASLFELLLIPILRGWNRIVIFVAFLGLVVVGRLLDTVRRRWLRGRPLVGGAMLVVVLVLGLLDQTSTAFVPDYSGNRARFQDDAEFVARIERTLPRGGLVFQLPFVPFPEAGPVNDMVDYDHFRGYLHSKRLRWSYGGIKGRAEADWAGSVAMDETEDMLARLSAIGFDGIYVDRAGYLDRGRATEEALRSSLGVPVVSRDGRRTFFDLGDFRRSYIEGADRATLRAQRRDGEAPVGVRWASGFYGLERGDQTFWQWARGDSVLELVNPDDGPRAVELEMEVSTRSGGPATVQLALPGEPLQSVTVTNGAQRLARRFLLAPGTTRVRLMTDDPGVQEPGERRDLRLQVIDLRVSSVADEEVSG